MQQGLITRYTVHCILKILKKKLITFDRVFLEKVINQNFTSRDRKMIQSIVLNSMRHYLYAEQIIYKFSKKFKKNNDSYFLLISAITQIFILGYNDFAVINTTVELTKDKRIKAPTSYINAILRNIVKNKDNIKDLEFNFNSFPKWLTIRLQHWDTKQKNNFIKTIKKEPNLHVVFKNEKDLKIFKIKNTKTTKNSAALENFSQINKINDFEKGNWWVQDFSSMMPLYLLKNNLNKKIADICAAPGGKTFQLIDYGANVTAFEKNSERIKIMQSNLKRLNLKCKIINIDILKTKVFEKFDYVILDSPCSSIGTIRRNPEIIFRNIIPNFKEIESTQYKLLNKAKDFLNKGGSIIYMVCSFLHEEGELQIEKFLKRNKNFSLLKFPVKIVENSQKLINSKGYYHIAPSELDNKVLIDGFFSAILKKND